MVLGPYPALVLWFLAPNSLCCSGNTQLWGKATEVSCFAFHYDQSVPLKFSSGTPLPVAEADCERLTQKHESEHGTLGLHQRWGAGRHLMGSQQKKTLLQKGIQGPG